MITKDKSIEEIIQNIPNVIAFLSEKGIRCIICGEPVWGTLEEAAKEKGFSNNEIDIIAKQLKKMK